MLSHLEAFDNLPVIKESHEALGKFVRDKEKYKWFKRLRAKCGSMGYLIFHLQKKLDFNSKRAWKQHLEGDEFPTTQKFSEFLSHRSKLLESEKTNLHTFSINQNKYSYGKVARNKNAFGTKSFVVTGLEEEKMCCL